MIVLGKSIPFDSLIRYLALRYTSGWERVQAHKKICDLVGEEEYSQWSRDFSDWCDKFLIEARKKYKHELYPHYYPDYKTGKQNGFKCIVCGAWKNTNDDEKSNYVPCFQKMKKDLENQEFEGFRSLDELK